MEKRLLDRITHKYFVIAFLALGALYLLNAILSIVYFVKSAGSSLLKAGLDLASSFGIKNKDYSNAIPTNSVSGIMLFILSLLFILLVVTIVAYIIKIVRENRVNCIFMNLPLAASTLMAITAFYLNFVIKSSAKGLGYFFCFLLLVESGFLIFFTIKSMVSNRLMVIQPHNIKKAIANTTRDFEEDQNSNTQE